ncbi:MAG: ATPase, activator of (R)-hydroxyglutaryl-CoA dehydratase [Candidatus Thorarchaeota archaeon]|nr:MAG: ATPase, activator of (R)-hydroxyglutaryl-CoA dehydratase [Candidatus Thorarchaeota archaeon]
MSETPSYTVGIDVGSTTTKGVVLSTDGMIITKRIRATGSSASDAAQDVFQIMTQESGLPLLDTITISTGYGRRQVDFAEKFLTEITCHCVGIHHLNPSIRLVIDIGGQDSKVIRVNEHGKPSDFELNDKCSAGTGRFLEVMAGVLGVTIDMLGSIALESNNPSTISSTCTVFAESEVVGHIGSGESASDIAAGIHQSMASKVGTLARRVGLVSPVALTGGVALNQAFQHHLAADIGSDLWIPEHPQFTGALGAAVIAQSKL